MAGLTQGQQSLIYEFTAKSPATIQQIAEKLGLIGKTAYLKVYNFFKTQKANIHFLTKKEDGLLWVRANPQKPLTLIFDKQITAKTKLASGRHCGETEKLDGLKHASPERWKAAHKMTRCNGYGYTDRETGDFIYTNNIYYECIKLFNDYVTRIRTENIEMLHSLDGDPVFSRAVSLPYKTRFTSQERQQEIRDAYRATWEAASKKHLKAVFLTLTAPPRAGSLWDTNMQMLKAWGNLRRFLDRLLPRGLTYICVREFQQNGRLHFHIIIFGVNWLLPIQALKKIWTSYGGGPVMNICALRQAPEGWTWARQAPRDAGGQAPGSYLSEYLEKSMSPKSGLNYWIYNVQFWTASKDIKQAPEKFESKGVWARVGVLAKTGKRVFSGGKTKSFLAGALLRTRKSSGAKTDNTIKKKKKLVTGFRRASDLSTQC